MRNKRKKKKRLQSRKPSQQKRKLKFCMTKRGYRLTRTYSFIETCQGAEVELGIATKNGSANVAISRTTTAPPTILHEIEPSMLKEPQNVSERWAGNPFLTVLEDVKNEAEILTKLCHLPTISFWSVHKRKTVQTCDAKTCDAISWNRKFNIHSTHSI